MIGAWTRCIMVTMAMTLVPAAAATAAEVGGGDRAARRHSFFLGIGAGPATVRPADQERIEEGISFQFTTEGNDLGGMGATGYWITDHVGFEVAYWSFGSVTVPFTFQDPHDNTSGTGESEVTFSGPSLSLLFGHDIGDFQLFGRVGAINWARDMDTRFDIPGEPAVRRQIGTTGTGATFGAGVGWRFHSAWRLQAQFERTTFDEDTIDLFVLGLQYDFAHQIFDQRAW